jgi:hypothetical protein
MGERTLARSIARICRARVRLLDPLGAPTDIGEKTARHDR